MVSVPPSALALPTAQRKLPTLPSSRVLVTVHVGSAVGPFVVPWAIGLWKVRRGFVVLGTQRSSSTSSVGRARNGTLRNGRTTGRANSVRIQECILIRNS